MNRERIEEIRRLAVDKYKDTLDLNRPDNKIEQYELAFAEIASIIAKDMLIDYHDDLTKEQE